MLVKGTQALVLVILLNCPVSISWAAESPAVDTQAQILMLTRAVARLQNEIDNLKQQQSLNRQLGARVSVLDKEMNVLRQMLAGMPSVPASVPAVKTGGQPVKTYFVPAGW